MQADLNELRQIITLCQLYNEGLTSEESCKQMNITLGEYMDILDLACGLGLMTNKSMPFFPWGEYSVNQAKLELWSKEVAEIEAEFQQF